MNCPCPQHNKDNETHATAKRCSTYSTVTEKGEMFLSEELGKEKGPWKRRHLLGTKESRRNVTGGRAAQQEEDRGTKGFPVA